MNTQLNRTVKNIMTHTQSFANTIQNELANTNFGKNLPIDLVLDMVNTIIKQEIGKSSVAICLSKPGSVMKSTLIPEIPKTPVIPSVPNKGKQITLQVRPFLLRDY